MKRFLCFFLALVLLLTLVPAVVLADKSADINMQASSKIRDLIKKYEGCMLTAYQDVYGYWTIGYGHTGYVPCKGENVKEGMTLTKQEAEDLLTNDLNTVYAPSVNKFVNQHRNLYPNGFTQNEFDVLVSLAFGFGAYWIDYYKDQYRLAKYLLNGIHNYSDAEIADAIVCLWSNLPGLLTRRMEEARIFLYGDYDGTGPNQLIYLKFGGATTVFSDSVRSGNTVACYIKGQPYGELPTAKDTSGGFFAGWRTADGQILKSTDIATKSQTVNAAWSSTKPMGGNCIYTVGNCPSEKFTDISTSFWAHAEIDMAVSMGLFNGTSATTFAPNSEMTRGMLVTVLYRMAGSPSVEGLTNEFPDVVKNSYYDAIIWAHKNNIAHGFQGGNFRPNSPVSREQFATFLQRFAANVYNLDTESGHYADLSKFSDAAKVATAYRESMSWAVGEGIINGTSATTLDPTGNATRAQVAVILARFTSNT